MRRRLSHRSRECLPPIKSMPGNKNRVIKQMEYGIMGVSIADKTMKALLYRKSWVRRSSPRLAVDFEQLSKRRHRASEQIGWW